MSKVIEYIKLVLLRCVSKVFWLFDAIGVGLFVANQSNMPHVPSWASIAVFSVVVLASCYSVWRDERKKVAGLQQQLDDLQDAIPKYDIIIGTIRKYSVSGLIAKYRVEISRPAPAANPLLAFSTSAALALGGETHQAKVDRLKAHLEELEALEDALQCTYAVELDIIATRSDKNIDIEITALQPAIFIELDDFADKFVPVTRAPQPFGRGVSSMFMDTFHRYSFELPNIKKPREDEHLGTENSVETTFNWLHANSKTPIFSQLWIQSEETEIKLKCVVHSDKRLHGQVIRRTIPVAGLAAEQLDDPSE